MTNLADGDDFEAFAVDWISGNIYFATSVTQVIDVISDSTSDIFVTSKNTEYFRSIIHKNPGLIKGIVLAPMLGKMYWHDKGKLKCLIQIAQSPVLIRVPSLEQLCVAEFSGEQARPKVYENGLENVLVIWLDLELMVKNVKNQSV